MLHQKKKYLHFKKIADYEVKMISLGRFFSQKKWKKIVLTFSPRLSQDFDAKVTFKGSKLG